MVQLLFISVLGLFALGVPIAISLGLASSFVIWYGDLTSLKLVVQQIFNSMNSFPLMAIPFFILAGNIMHTGGISQRLVNLAKSLVGNITGGLAMVAVITSMFFAAISGSGAATTAAIGSILIPAMVASGYDDRFAAANQACAGALGVIIPPSIPLILYGIAAQQSVGDLFIAGILPGIFITMTLLITVYIFSKKNGYKDINKNDDIMPLGLAFRQAIFSLLMPIIILGGIYGGVFTPTEAAVIAVVYALFVGFVIYREIKISDLPNIFRDSAVTTAIVLIIIGAAGLFSFILNRLNIPSMIQEMFLNLSTSPVLFLILVNILLLIAGMFIEAAAAILILVPILLPISHSLGIDPIHFGIIMVVNLAIGLITPPVGINLFVASQISKLKLEQISRAMIPFIIILFVDVIILSFIPEISIWLPSVIK
jgi:C4-dicarboxylate transporter DctM subunit